MPTGAITPSMTVTTRANELRESLPLFGPLLNTRKNMVVGFYFILPTQGRINKAENACERIKGNLYVGQVLTPGTYTIDLNDDSTNLVIEFVLPKGTPACFTYNEERSSEISVG